jgi:hypothetical protein
LWRTITVGDSKKKLLSHTTKEMNEWYNPSQIDKYKSYTPYVFQNIERYGLKRYGFYSCALHTVILDTGYAVAAPPMSQFGLSPETITKFVRIQPNKPCCQIALYTMWTQS